MSLTNNPMELRGAARLATAALSLFLIAGACTSALAFRMQVAVPPTQTTPTASHNHERSPTRPAHQDGCTRRANPNHQRRRATASTLQSRAIPDPSRTSRWIAAEPTPTPAAPDHYSVNHRPGHSRRRRARALIQTRNTRRHAPLLLPPGSYTLKVLPPTSSDHTPQVPPGPHVAADVIAGNRIALRRARLSRDRQERRR